MNAHWQSIYNGSMAESAGEHSDHWGSRHGAHQSHLYIDDFGVDGSKDLLVVDDAEFERLREQREQLAGGAAEATRDSQRTRLPARRHPRSLALEAQPQRARHPRLSQHRLLCREFINRD